MNTLTVLNCGTTVTLKGQNINAIITCVSLRFNKVTYEVSYFINGDYRAIFLDACEFEVTKDVDKQKSIIGFKDQPS